MLIAPSILNADNLNLENDVKDAIAAGISRFHIDIMDGHFVPNLSFGPQLVQDFKREFPMTESEIHLMSDNPDDLIPAFVDAGADLIELHYEAMSEKKLDYWLDYLISNDVKTSLAINPDTPSDVVAKFASKLDEVIKMNGGYLFRAKHVHELSQNKHLDGK